MEVFKRIMVTYSNFFFSNAKIPIPFDLFSPPFYRKTQIIPNILLQSGYNMSLYCFKGILLKKIIIFDNICDLFVVLN